MAKRLPSATAGPLQRPRMEHGPPVALDSEPSCMGQRSPVAPCIGHSIPTADVLWKSSVWPAASICAAQHCGDNIANNEATCHRSQPMDHALSCRRMYDIKSRRASLTLRTPTRKIRGSGVRRLRRLGYIRVDSSEAA